MIGPLARSAEDLECVLRLVAGPDLLESAGMRVELPPLDKRTAQLRVAVWKTDPMCPSSRDVIARVEAVAGGASAPGGFISW